MVRIIPARAGNTPIGDYANWYEADHPRAGGEHVTDDDLAVVFIGSSPRGRGTLPIRVVEAPAERIIPARAGNTRTGSPRTGTSTDHPRAGGEHLRVPVQTEHSSGSSPRGRGTRPLSRTSRRGWGIIPARAGNTIPRPWATIACTDHPRAGGEHPFSIMAAVSSPGSSPRGRGTRLLTFFARLTRWIIPARAGNTAFVRTPLAATADHPRAGGEHGQATRSFWRGTGSSPRGRGTLCSLPPPSAYRRIIPARAGNTSRKSPKVLPRADHPRAGGEHPVRAWWKTQGCGSSPRGRGTPGHRHDHPRQLRIIPARAGNTRNRACQESQ